MRRKLDEMSKEVGRLKAVQPTVSENAAASAPSQNQSPPAAPTEQRRQVRCFNCNELGHVARYCQQPNRLAQQSAPAARGSGPVTGAVKGTSATGDVVSERKTYLRLTVNNATRKVLLDTGSDATLFPSFAVAGVPVESCAQQLLAANGTVIRVRGKTTVRAFSGEHEFMISGLVTDHVAEVMLGIDFLQEHGAVWNFKTGEVEFDGYVQKLCSKVQPRWCR